MKTHPLHLFPADTRLELADGDFTLLTPVADLAEISTGSGMVFNSRCRSAAGMATNWL